MAYLSVLEKWKIDRVFRPTCGSIPKSNQFPPIHKISCKSVHNVLSIPHHRQTSKSENIISFFGGGNYNMERRAVSLRRLSLLLTTDRSLKPGFHSNAIACVAFEWKPGFNLFDFRGRYIATCCGKLLCFRPQSAQR